MTWPLQFYKKDANMYNNFSSYAFQFCVTLFHVCAHIYMVYLKIIKKIGNNKVLLTKMFNIFSDYSVVMNRNIIERLFILICGKP